MSCMENYIKDANFADTGFSYTMSLISGKHKMVILYCLMERMAHWPRCRLRVPFSRLMCSSALP